MAFQITGKLELVGETIAHNSSNGGQPFYKREFVLDCTRYNPDTGDPWYNYPKFELSGNKCTLIDQFQIGQRLTVDFSLKGSKYTDEKTKETKYFTTISAFGIALAQQPGQQQNGYQPATVPTNQQPVQMVQQPYHAQPEGTVEEKDDLPF